MMLGINMVGGGWVQIQIEADSLSEVSDWLRRDRSLIGQLIPSGAEGLAAGEVLIPAHRIAMVNEI